MNRPENLTHKVTEADILKISKLMGCFEDTIKEIIRSKRPMPDDMGQSEMYFYETSSRALCELETDQELKCYFDV